MFTDRVALTFDDGPHPQSTRALLVALVAWRAHATFFVCGDQAERFPDQLRALDRAGMGIGNHSFTHARLPGSGPAIDDELERTQQTVHSLTGRYPALFRPPYGETDDDVRRRAAALGMTEVLWTVDTRDWSGVSTEEIVAAAAAVQPGGVILMHDGGYRTTVEALPRILRILALRGLRPGRIVPGRTVEPDGRRALVLGP
jgi:peptidoglycan/xylan/chitin deacetylase (PgdA/CDA1 family)